MFKNITKNLWSIFLIPLKHFGLFKKRIKMFRIQQDTQFRTLFNYFKKIKRVLKDMND